MAGKKILMLVGDYANFSSFLRLCCGRYLALHLSGPIPADRAVPIRSLDADWVLAAERPPTGVSRRRRVNGIGVSTPAG